MGGKKRQEPFTSGPLFLCPECWVSFRAGYNPIASFFAGEKVGCELGRCGKSYGGWQVLEHEIRNNHIGRAWTALGARTTFFKIELEPQLPVRVKFEEHGVPLGARIVQVGYNPGLTASGTPLIPMEMHSNVPHRRIINNQVLLYPRGSSEAGSATCDVNVIWLPGSSDESWQSLVDAFEAYGSSQFQGTIIPANIAVESMLAKAFDSFLRTFLSNNRIEAYWEKHVTYSVQMNIILPMLACVGKVASLPQSPDLLGELNRLRKLRNQLGHSGRLEGPIDGPETARLLTAAVIGFWYMHELCVKLTE